MREKSLRMNRDGVCHNNRDGGAQGHWRAIWQLKREKEQPPKGAVSWTGMQEAILRNLQTY